MKIKILLFLFFTTLPLFIYSESRAIDSLQSILQTEIPDTTRLRLLLEISTGLETSNFESAEDYCLQLIDLSKKIKQDRFTAEGYYALLNISYNKNSSIDTMTSIFDEAIIYAEKIEDISLKSMVLDKMAAMYKRLGQSQKSLTLFHEALDIATLLKDTIQMTRSLNNMGTLLENTNEGDKATVYYKQALIYARKLKKTNYIAAITNNMAIVYHNQLKYDTASILYEEALGLKRKLGNEFSMVTTLANLGRLNTDIGNYELSQNYLNEAYEIATRLNYPYGKVLTLKNLGERSFATEQYRQAIKYAKEGLKILEETEEIMILEAKLHLVLADSYEKTQQHELALESSKNYHILKDSLLEKDKMKEIWEVESEYVLKQKEIENKLLKSEQAIIEKTLRNRTIIGIGLIIAFILALGWALAAYRSSQQRKRINDMLEEEVRKRTKELEAINKDLEQANYELRTYNYIASHDIKEPIKNIGNFVGFIHRQLPEEQKSKLGDYFQMIKRGIAQLYTLLEDFARYNHLSKNEVLELKPVDLNIIVEGIESNLQPILKDKNAIIKRSDLPIISSNASFVFVALKNLIENGLKFNDADTPTVALSYQEANNHHEIKIADNGIGIEPCYFDQIFEMFKQLHPREQYEGSGIGLAIVKLVMDKLGGEVGVVSNQDRGSQFYLKFPK